METDRVYFLFLSSHKCSYTYITTFVCVYKFDFNSLIDRLRLMSVMVNNYDII